MTEKKKTKRPPITPEERVEEPKVVDRLGRVTQRNVRAMCSARRVDGEACRAYAAKGAAVCSRHGGSAPQVRRAAAVRLAMSSDWLIAALLKIAKSGEDEKTRLTAINSALDRVGLGTRSTLEIDAATATLKPFEQDLRNAIVRVVKVQVDADGNETVIEGAPPKGERGFLRDLPTDADDEVDAYSRREAGMIIDAEVVEDEPPPDPANVVRLPDPAERRARPRSAMLSQTDLQDPQDPPRSDPSVRPRNTRTDFSQ